MPGGDTSVMGAVGSPAGDGADDAGASALRGGEDTAGGRGGSEPRAVEGAASEGAGAMCGGGAPVGASVGCAETEPPEVSAATTRATKVGNRDDRIERAIKAAASGMR